MIDLNELISDCDQVLQKYEKESNDRQKRNEDILRIKEMKCSQYSILSFISFSLYAVCSFLGVYWLRVLDEPVFSLVAGLLACVSVIFVGYYLTKSCNQYKEIGKIIKKWQEEGDASFAETMELFNVLRNKFNIRR